MGSKKINNHTPGPWMVGADGNSVWKTKTDIFICDCDDDRNDKDITEANAQLIAVAPEMLKALRGVVAKYNQIVNSGGGSFPREFEDYLVKVRATIAKARGERI